MTSEVPATSANTQLVHGGKLPTAATSGQTSGKNLPSGGSPTAVSDTVATAATTSAGAGNAPNRASPKHTGKTGDKSPATPPPDVHALVAHLNKHLQSSGRPNTYKLDSSSGHALIQEINPDTQQVVSEIPATEFKALAQELGISGLLVDARA